MTVRDEREEHPHNISTRGSPSTLVTNRHETVSRLAVVDVDRNDGGSTDGVQHNLFNDYEFIYLHG
jgi:hypothetical protein